MVDSLEVAHLLQHIVGHPTIAPLYVPIFSLTEALGLPVQAVRTAHLLQYRVFCVFIMEQVLDKFTVAIRPLPCFSRIYR